MAELGGGDSASLSTEQSVDEQGDLVLRIEGELDLSNVDALRPELMDIVAEQPDRVILELASLSFMDSSGIALLVEAAQQVGSLELRNPSAVIRRVLEATGLVSVFRIAP